MATLDIFNNDAFNVVEMTDALDKVPHVPDFLESLGIFESEGIRTRSASFEKRDNVLSLVQTTPLGAPLGQRVEEKRTLRDFRTVRVAKGDTIYAHEIQGIRQFGKETEIKQVKDEVMRRMLRLRADIDLTHENLRLGAINGLVIDADGSTTLHDWFAEWGVARPADINFVLTTYDQMGGIAKTAKSVIRAMKRNAKGAWLPSTRVVALCSDTFYDDLIGNKEVRETYLNQLQAAQLRGEVGAAFESFKYGNIEWVNYQGTDDNSTVAIPTGKCRFIPVGAKQVFKRVNAPMENFTYANTVGQPSYAMVIPDEKRQMQVDVEVYTYPLYVCERPEMLFTGNRT